MIYKKVFGKINWVLKVFKKETGVTKHKIDSVMQIFPAMFDKIGIKKHYRLEVQYLYQGKTPMKMENCSITRAVKWINKTYPEVNTNYKIVVKKFIPIGGGFGGESTDAAYVLRYILKKYKLNNLSDQQLLDIALNVGSDIPFFYKKTFIAHVNEYGNRVVPLKYSIPFNPDIIPFHTVIKTKDIYDMVDKDKKYESLIHDVKKLYDDLKVGGIEKHVVYNDLQRYVLKKEPKIKQAIEKYNLNDKAINFINGAGSTIITVKK